jgi:hypothetical protein
VVTPAATAAFFVGRFTAFWKNGPRVLAPAGLRPIFPVFLFLRFPIAFTLSHSLCWLFRKQSSETAALNRQGRGPAGLLSKNLPCSLRSRGIFFGKALSFSPPCSGEVAYKKPPEAIAEGEGFKRQKT